MFPDDENALNTDDKPPQARVAPETVDSEDNYYDDDLEEEYSEN